MNTSHTDASAAGRWSFGDAPTIARLGFGAMRLPARSWTGPAVPREHALAVLRRTAELGVDHIDTAAFYTFADIRANELIRTALHPYDESLVIATKVGPIRPADGSPPFAGGPADLTGAVEQNLRELGLDRLDLVYLRVGAMTTDDESVAERFEVLAGLRERGLIRHLGLSNITVDQLTEAQAIAPVVAVQNYYNLLRQDDRDLLARCEKDGIAFVPFFPLGGHALVESETLDRVAARHGATAAQIALAWLLDSSPAMLAIAGTSSVAHLEENVAAAAIRLTDSDRADLA
jgi:aryl-alcohol dehydrogenase-like predicted oxidoreductase